MGNFLFDKEKIHKNFDYCRNSIYRVFCSNCYIVFVLIFNNIWVMLENIYIFNFLLTSNFPNVFKTVFRSQIIFKFLLNNFTNIYKYIEKK